MSLAGAVEKLSEEQPVTRRSALVYDGTSPRPVGPAATLTAVVRLHMQRDTSKPTRLVRASDGDETEGEARVWVSERNLALAYEQGDATETPLGWTELQIAPPEDTDGPPGDLVDWNGRRWEIIEFQGWERKFGGYSRFRRYLAAERGASS